MTDKTQTETPWTDLLPLLLSAMENSKSVGYNKAVLELHQMAKMADIGAQAVAWQRKAEETGAVLKWNGHTVIR